MASSAGSLRSVEVKWHLFLWTQGRESWKNLITEFWRLQEQTEGKKPHHKLHLRLVLSITEPCTTWFCCLIWIFSQATSPPSPGALSKFWGDPKEFLATRERFKFGEFCIICIFLPYREKTALPVLAWKIFIALPWFFRSKMFLLWTENPFKFTWKVLLVK